MMCEEGTSATTAAMICVVMKPGAPRAGREVPLALASSLTEQPQCNVPTEMCPFHRVSVEMAPYVCTWDRV